MFHFADRTANHIEALIQALLDIRPFSHPPYSCIPICMAVEMSVPLLVSDSHTQFEPLVPVLLGMSCCTCILGHRDHRKSCHSASVTGDCNLCLTADAGKLGQRDEVRNSKILLFQISINRQLFFVGCPFRKRINV